jgi:hypothetical protein
MDVFKAAGDDRPDQLADRLVVPGRQVMQRKAEAEFGRVAEGDEFGVSRNCMPMR